MEILIISGLSGAGKSSAATYLEDMGYYTVDNVPADIILKFAEFCAQSDGRYDRVALVSDIRSGNGNFQGILDAMERLKQGGDICRLLFVTADLETIIKRYKETRRRHPLMSDGMTIEQAMHREQELLRPLREHADFVIDTTLMPAAKLRNELYGLFGDKSARGKLSVNIVSFGFKYGIPLEADLVFDVRFLPNPFYVPELKHKTGMDSEVYDYVFSFPQTKTFIDKLEGMLSFLLPLYAEEGKSTLVIAVGCTGGHHRSVSVARCMASYLTALGYPAFENSPRHHARLKQVSETKRCGMSFAYDVKRSSARFRSPELLRRGRGLRRAAVLPHVHDAGDPHRHGVRRLCRAAAEAVSPRVRRALCPAGRGKGRRPPRADHHRPRRRRDGVRRLRRRPLAHGRAPH